MSKKILIIALFVILSLILIFFLLYSLGLKMLSKIDVFMSHGEKNIQPMISKRYNLSDSQCEKVFASVFIVAVTGNDDYKKLLNLSNDDNSKKTMQNIKELNKLLLVSVALKKETEIIRLWGSMV